MGKILPPEEVIPDLPAPPSDFVETVVKYKFAAAAQDAAEKRGRKREADEKLPDECNCGDKPVEKTFEQIQKEKAEKEAAEKEKKKHHHDKDKDKKTDASEAKCAEE